jgi:hypothetical protein
VLRLLETYVPEANVTLWPTKVDHGVDQLLMTRFPKLRIAQDKASQREALQNCDILLHGSGPSLVAKRHVEHWIAKTGKWKHRAPRIWQSNTQWRHGD